MDSPNESLLRQTPIEISAQRCANIRDVYSTNTRQIAQYSLRVAQSYTMPWAYRLRLIVACRMVFSVVGNKHLRQGEGYQGSTHA